MKKVLKHLKKAHGAALRNDHKSVRFHIGHVLAATRQAMNGGPEEQDPAEAEPDTDQDDTTISSKHWIAGAITHPGALHKELGVPQGQTIPAGKLTAAAHSTNPTLAKRANLAKTLKAMHKK